MRLLPLLVVLSSLACRSSQRTEPPQAAAPAPAPAAPAPAPAVPAPVKSEADKAKERSERAAAALTRVSTIKEGLAKLRGLEFRADVPAALQSSADFRSFLRTTIDSELPAPRAEAIATAYAQLGLIERPLDLRKTLEDAMVSQAGAYYDPAAKKFFLVMVPSSDLMLDTITAHELTHALQDQHFDLQAYYNPKDKQLVALGEDAMNARRFIVEGEATLTMLAYVTGAMTKRDALSPELRPALQLQLNAIAGLGIDQLKAMTKQQQVSAFFDMGDDIRAAIEAMDTIPLALLLPLLESYGRGALPVFAAYKKGGWDEVAKLYRQPPESTEQVLHPDEKLFPTRELPRMVTLAKAPAGYREVHSDTIGELLWRVYFLLWDKPSSDSASAGWGGDRYRVLRGSDGALLTQLVTAWDSEADASEFEAAYRRSLVKRFGGDGAARPGGASVAVQRRGTEVFIVDGAGADKALAALVKGSKIK
jgi:hypothetical protein